MRSETEIHRAHDILISIVLGEVVPSLAIDDRTMLGLRAALDALCWAMEHDHNRSFADNLQRIEENLTKAGYHLHRKNN